MLGHKTLTMTMELYAKVRRGTPRQAVARLSYGKGARSPERVVEFPAREKMVRICPQSARRLWGELT